MAESSLKRILRYLTIKLKSFFLSKDVLSFLVFLLLSASFWFINALNTERDLTFRIPVRYEGLPDNVLFLDELPSEVSLKVRDIGKKLWTYISHPPSPVEIRFDHQFKDNGLVSVTNARLSQAVAEKLFPTTVVLALSPEHFVAKYVSMYSRTLPVELDADISLQSQYMFSFPTNVHPDSVRVFGPKATIDGMVSVKTSRLEIKNLKDTLTQQIDIHPLPSLQFSPSKVTVTAGAQMFTEKNATLPVQVLNIPEHLNVITFPAEVRATFNIGVAYFKLFKSSDIQIVLDYNELRSSAYPRKSVRIINNKPYIANIRIQPAEVEFLLEERK